MPKHDDIVIRNLKARFFDLIKKEEIGKTPDITRELDNLQDAIRRLQKEAAIC
jgi:hypothetical protein